MKRILTTILSVIMLLTVSMFVLTACDGCGEKITELPEEQVEAYVNLSLAEKQMIVGDETTLIATTPLIEGETVAWSTSDEKIATVNADGTVTAIRPGETDITATFAGKTDSCKISVSLGSHIPVIEFENQIINDTLSVAKNSAVNLGAYVKFNNKVFNDATFTYTVKSGDGLGSVDGYGKFTANGEKGTVVIEVKANWREIESPELTRLITINVVPNYMILIDEGRTSSIDLYTVASHGGETYSISDILEDRILAFEDDTDKLSSLQVSVDNQQLGFESTDNTLKVVDFNASTLEITALNFGTADLVLSFTTSENETFTRIFPITVSRPVADRGTTIEWFSALDGDIDVSAIFGSNVTLVDAYQNDNALTVTDNKVLGLTLTNRDAVSNEVITIYDNKVGYTVNLEAYTMVIDSASDFAVFSIDTETTIIDGYYVLKNDITTKEEVIINHYGLHQSKSSLSLTDTIAWNYDKAGFKGVFDGLGHKVTMTLKGGMGIFGQTLNGALIKNVAFYDIDLVGYKDKYACNKEGVLVEAQNKKVGDNPLLFYSIQNNHKNVHIKDVYVHISSYTSAGSYMCGVIFGAGYVNITGLVVDFDPTFTSLQSGKGALFAYSKPTYASFKGVIAITDQALAGQETSSANWQFIGCNEGKTNNQVIDGVTYIVKENTYRYANYASLAQNKAELVDQLQNFNTDIWDLSSGFPMFKAIEYEDGIQMVDSLSLTAGVDDTATLTAFNFTSDATPVFSCASNDVIDVTSAGVITVKGIGTADVIVDIGGEQATCTVTVGWANDTAPVLTIDGINPDEPLYVNYGETVDFVAKLIYNGAEVDGLEYTWTSAIGGTFADEHVGTFQAPDTYADGNLRATVTYYGETLYVDFHVLVATDPEMKVNGEEPTDIELYTNATWGGDYSIEADFLVTTDVAGVTIQSIEVQNQNVAIYNDNKITSVGLGETYVVVTFKDSQNNEITRSVKITVYESIKDVDEVLDYSAMDGKIIGIEQYFEEQGEVVIDRAYLNDTALTVESDNKITGIDAESKTVQTVELIVGSGTKAIRINVNVYKMVIDSADDLAVFAHAKSSDVVSGYYIVANDITLEGSSWAGNAHYRDWKVSGMFDGVFDGNGHSVELKLNYGGLLGLMAPGSVVKDVAFIVKQMSTTGSHRGNVIANKATGLANDSRIVIENVYVEWDLPEGTVLDTAHNGSGQDFGLGLFGEQPLYANFSNIVINMTGVTKQTASMDFRYGTLYSKINASSSATWADSALSNIYVINQDKYFALNHNVGTSADGYPILNTFAAVHFASNDTEALAEFKTANPNVTKAFAYSGIKRYDSAVAFAADKANNDYSSFDTSLWDLSGGFPIFKSVQSRFAFYYIGNSSTATEVQLLSTGTPESTTLYANVSGVDYIPTVSFVSGDDVVNIDANTVTAKANSFGKAVIKAIYDINGTPVEKQYTIAVIGEAWSGDAIKFSTLDAKIYFDKELEDVGIVSVIDAVDGTVYYEEGCVTSDVPNNNDSTDLASNTVNCVIELTDGSKYAIDLVSYTKVITTDDDLTVFNIEKNTNLLGYFIVNNDIILDSFTGNTHGNGFGATGKFKGVFDGNGHVIEVALKKNGLFGTTESATIKNAAFVVKQINSTGSVSASVLAFDGGQSESPSTISNVYVTYAKGLTVNVGYNSWGQAIGLGLYYQSTYENFDNVVVDMSQLELTTDQKEIFSYGATFSKFNATYNSEGNINPRYNDVIFYSTTPYVAYSAPAKTGSEYTCPAYPQYVAFAGNQGAEYDAFVEANSTAAKKAVVYKYTSVLKYANQDALATAQANLSGFDANLWDTSKGYPEFKGMVN